MTSKGFWVLLWDIGVVEFELRTPILLGVMTFCLGFATFCSGVARLLRAGVAASCGGVAKLLSKFASRVLLTSQTRFVS